MAERARTTWQCRWVPRRTRKRVYTAADAARIACRVTRSGKGTFADITARYRTVCAGERPKASEAEIALEKAATALEDNNTVLDNAWNLFNFINGLIAALALLGLVVPQARFARFLTGSGAATVAAAMTTITARVAANQATYAIVRQAAANAARFRIAA